MKNGERQTGTQTLRKKKRKRKNKKEDGNSQKGIYEKENKKTPRKRKTDG